MNYGSKLCEIERKIYDPNLAFYVDFSKHDGTTFQSDDAYGKLCTATGAAWGTNGRTFVAATPDYIEATAPQLNFTSGDFSMVARIYIDILATTRYLVVMTDNNANGWLTYIDASGVLVVFTYQAGAASQFSVGNAGGLVISTWYTLGFSRHGDTITLYKNGVEDTGTHGTHIDPDSCSVSAKIGIWNDKTTGPFDGIIKAVGVWSKCLTPVEQMAKHLAFKEI